MRAGLIPSRALQERCIILEREQKEKSDDDNISKSRGLRPNDVKCDACASIS